MAINPCDIMLKLRDAVRILNNLLKDISIHLHVNFDGIAMSARCICLRVINHTQLIYVAFQPSKPRSVIQKNVLALRSSPLL